MGQLIVMNPGGRARRRVVDLAQWRLTSRSATGVDGQPSWVASAWAVPGVDSSAGTSQGVTAGEDRARDLSPRPPDAA